MDFSLLYDVGFFLSVVVTAAALGVALYVAVVCPPSKIGPGALVLVAAFLVELVAGLSSLAVRWGQKLLNWDLKPGFYDWYSLLNVIAYALSGLLMVAALALFRRPKPERRARLEGVPHV